MKEKTYFRASSERIEDQRIESRFLTEFMTFLRKFFIFV